MKCEKCGGRTEVLETKQRDQRTLRRRQCLDCGNRFTTREALNDQSFVSIEEALPGWLKKAARKGKPMDVIAISAAIATDRRRARIREEQRALDRKERDALRDAGFDEQADALDRESLRRELEGY